MGYRDKKNPWHVLFDKFKDEHRELVDKIKIFHPIIYPVIQVDFLNGEKLLYNGKTRKITYFNEETYNRALWDLLTT